jgi:hypothetical protein
MQDSITTIRLMDVVAGTATNVEGIMLFNVVDNILSNNQKVRLSLEGATPFSTSFLNSSIGSLVDKYGIETIRKRLVFSNLTKSQIKKITSYFEMVSC